MLGQLDAVDQTLATLRGGTTTRITIGVTPWVARVLLGPTLHLLIRRRPDVRFDIHELIGAEYSALRDGTLDMAIGVAPPSDVAEFTVRPLLDYSITVSCRPGHPLSNARELEELAGQDWVLIGEIEHHTPASSACGAASWRPPSRSGCITRGLPRWSAPSSEPRTC